MTAQPVSPETSEEVKDRIIHSSLKLFARKGYAATSLREIAEEARTTKPMIYYYFGNKEGLYVSLLKDQLQGLGEAIERAIDPAADIETNVRNYASAYVDYILAQEECIALLLREMFGLGEQVVREFTVALEAQVRSHLRRLLEKGMEQGRYRDIDPEACSLAINGIIHTFVMRRVYRDIRIDKERVLSQVIDYYVRGLMAH
ncbi:MAG TPA: TetR/AcrR family transcriptional regulator [Dehalococcoidia bacterium]